MSVLQQIQVEYASKLVQAKTASEVELSRILLLLPGVRVDIITERGTVNSCWRQCVVSNVRASEEGFVIVTDTDGKDWQVSGADIIGVFNQ